MGIQRFDPRLVNDMCGNKDVIMRESHDGSFVRYEAHEAQIERMRAALRNSKNVLETIIPDPSQPYANIAQDMITATLIQIRAVLEITT